MFKVILGSFGALISTEIAHNSNTAGRKAKPAEIWDSSVTNGYKG